jgi:hypothetical protein
MKIRPQGADFFFMWTDVQKDMKKLIVALRNFATDLRIAVLKASGDEA